MNFKIGVILLSIFIISTFHFIIRNKIDHFLSKTIRVNHADNCKVILFLNMVRCGFLIELFAKGHTFA